MNRIHILPAKLLCLLTAFFVMAVVIHAAPLRVSFATAGEGRQELTKTDDFVERLSPFDRAARLKSSKDVPQKEYLTHIGKSVKEWTPKEKERVTKAIEMLRPDLEALGVSWPKNVLLVRTDGSEEGGAAYTRGTVIVLPDEQLAEDSDSLSGLLAHEFFHILSRHHPELKDALYEVIGFKPCAEPQLAPALAARKITNPDAPRNDHAIELTVAGQKRKMIPILLSRTAKYEGGGGEFFESMEMAFVPADAARPLTASDLIESGKLEGFMEQVGRNTGYVIHPEEILADNFKLMITGAKNVRTPAVIERLKKVIAGAAAKKPAK